MNDSSQTNGSASEGAGRKKGKPLSVVTIRFFKNSIEASIHGFEHLGRARLERGVRQLNREYHRERRSRLGVSTSLVPPVEQDGEEEGGREDGR